MRSQVDRTLYCSPLAPIVSFDDLPNRFGDDDDGGSDFDSPLFLLPDPSPDPEERLLLTRTADEVLAFVKSLTPREQEIVHCVFWLGESQTVVAIRLGISRMAVCKALQKIYRLGRMRLVSLGNFEAFT